MSSAHHIGALPNGAVSEHQLSRSGNFRLLAGEFKDFATNRTHNEVEESGDGACPCLWTQEVIALNDIVLVEQNGYWDGALVEDIPLFERRLVRGDSASQRKMRQGATQPYQSHVARKGIIRHTSIYCIIRNKNIVRNEREGRIGIALETLRWRADCRAQAPYSICYAFLRDVRIIEKRGTKR